VKWYPESEYYWCAVTVDVGGGTRMVWCSGAHREAQVMDREEMRECFRSRLAHWAWDGAGRRTG
jgi:hypothetical protein